jgi:hypothetical protein
MGLWAFYLWRKRNLVLAARPGRRNGLGSGLMDGSDLAGQVSRWAMSKQCQLGPRLVAMELQSSYLKATLPFTWPSSRSAADACDQYAGCVTSLTAAFLVCSAPYRTGCRSRQNTMDLLLSHLLRPVPSCPPPSHLGTPRPVPRTGDPAPPERLIPGMVYHFPVSLSARHAAYNGPNNRLSP